MEEYHTIGDAQLESCCYDLAMSLQHRPTLRFVRLKDEPMMQMMEGTKYVRVYYCPFCGEKFNIIDNKTSYKLAF